MKKIFKTKHVKLKTLNENDMLNMNNITNLAFNNINHQDKHSRNGQSNYKTAQQSLNANIPELHLPKTDRQVSHVDVKKKIIDKSKIAFDHKTFTRKHCSNSVAKLKKIQNMSHYMTNKNPGETTAISSIPRIMPKIQSERSQLAKNVILSIQGKEKQYAKILSKENEKHSIASPGLTPIKGITLKAIPQAHSTLSQTELHKKTTSPEVINIKDFLYSNPPPISLSALKMNFQHYEGSIRSTKSHFIIKAYAAATHQGMIRNYNEDRVSIALNVTKPNTYTENDYWPRSSMFGLFDGHGGSGCCEYLRDKLHHFIFQQDSFPNNPREAIQKGFEIAEKDFLSNIACQNEELADRSGSCAITLIFINDTCYIANVGDSRALMSKCKGKVIEVLTTDHKPKNVKEEKRIIDAGGKVYQSQTSSQVLTLGGDTPQIFLGPHRVFPGRLSVSRSFGDVESKMVKFGGNPNVLIATPDIISIKITDEIDFMVIGCDGIFDQMSNEDICECVWRTLDKEVLAHTIHEQCGIAADMIIKSSLMRNTYDNVTCVIIAFEQFERCLRQMQEVPAQIDGKVYVHELNHTHNHTKFHTIQLEDVHKDKAENQGIAGYTFKGKMGNVNCSSYKHRASRKSISLFQTTNSIEHKFQLQEHTSKSKSISPDNQNASTTTSQSYYTRANLLPSMPVK